MRPYQRREYYSIHVTVRPRLKLVTSENTVGINKRALRTRYTSIVHRFWLVHGRFISTHLQQVSIQCAICVNFNTTA